MSIQEVVVHAREESGKGPAGRLRRSGLIPSVVYGFGRDARSISVEPKAIARVIQSEKGLNSVLNLRLDDTDKTSHVMIRSVDRHPVTDRLLHVDFLRIDMDKKVRAVIPVEFTGSPEGVKLGGVLTIVRHEVEVECLPKDLPGVLRVDATNLGLDEALRIGDLPQTEGVEYVLGPKRMVAVVHAPDHGGGSVSEEDGEEEEEA